MAVLETCCCCSVKTGSLVFGVFMLIGSIWTVVRDVKDIMAGVMSDKDQEDALQELNLTREQMNTFILMSYWITVANLLLSLATLIFSSLLLYGVIKGIAKFVKPILVFIPIDLVAGVIFVCIYSINVGFLHPLSTMLNIACLIIMVYYIFIWLCFYSHYQQLSDAHYGGEIRPA